MNPLPTGTVTFLFTDIEGSSRLWENYGDTMAVALARHDAILRETVEARGGNIFKTIGDAFCVAFPVATGALEAAVAAQRLLRDEPWQDIERLKVRIGIHTGSAESRDGDFFGPVLNRVSRLLAAAHGGQVLLTLATEELVRDHLPEGISLRDLGERRLRDLNRPERVFQVVAPDLPSDFPALRSLEIFPNNLPVQLTSFIGREKEMNEVKRLLGTTHLLTLTGTGGTGKTRLSMQVAADLLDQFSDGVWLIELATIEDADQVAPAIAAPLRVREEPGQQMLLTLTNYLRNKKLMLILDNCEHLIAECARIAETLLRACPGLQILASSREPLGIAGERTWPVPSLSIPESWRDEIRGSQAAERLTQYEAVRLFIDRATAVRPGFKVSNENAPYIAEICWRLDGIPLAIELAAARIRILSLDQIASRLNDQFRLLTGGSRTALPRQQTLRALIDWSFDLLSDQERILLRRLTVFAGGRTLGAVEAVCSDEKLQDFEIIDVLTTLVDKSLVSVEKSAGQGTALHLPGIGVELWPRKIGRGGRKRYPSHPAPRILPEDRSRGRAEPSRAGPVTWLERLQPESLQFPVRPGFEPGSRGTCASRPQPRRCPRQVLGNPEHRRRGARTARRYSGASRQCGADRPARRRPGACGPPGLAGGQARRRALRTRPKPWRSIGRWATSEGIGAMTVDYALYRLDTVSSMKHGSSSSKARPSPGGLATSACSRASGGRRGSKPRWRSATRNPSRSTRPSLAHLPGAG